MHTIANGYRGVTLLARLNLDRLLYIATIGAALWAGAWLGTLGLN